MNQDLLDVISRIRDVDVFAGISKYGKDVPPLRTLVDVLQKRPCNILELILRYRFQSDVFPKESFSPLFIIEHMIEMHNIRRNINTGPSDNVRLTYQYKSDDQKEEYVFSNNMTIYDDVITICYLYCIMTTESEYKESVPVNYLREMMRKKYVILDDLDISQSSARHDDSQRVTWFRIAHSFPSITFSIFYHDIVDVSISLCTTFPNVNLPKIFNVPSLLLASIIPRFSQELAPVALLLTFAVLVDNNEERRHGEKNPLCKLWEDIYDLYTCNVFPLCFKLTLCYMWGIPVTNKSIFNLHFREVCVKALDLISYLRPDDPDLRLLSFL